FAVQLSRPPEQSARSWAEVAKKAEDLGFSALLMPDHFGDQLAPLPALVAAAGATERLRVGTLVLDNDYRHPMVLAKEAATVDLLSDGRLELGMGAGWMRSDYQQSGLAYDAPAMRIERFEEAVQVVIGLLESEGPYSFSGRHYTISEHAFTPRPTQRPRPPLMIGGGGRRVLGVAARYADIVSINVDLRDGTGGPEVAPNASPESTRRKIGWVRHAAGERFQTLELNSLIGFAVITDDARSVSESLAPVFGVPTAEVLHVPLALIGTLGEIEEELRWRREEYGISYYSLEADCWENLGPVVVRLSGT
ncbi:MAG TPA: TIGR03621 family F420-dependent LLM class oxidoreductase, partial [Acidimicrobiales bacterium]|nr:TIGR03621 family F420-dependent LLM class oxidoreductase [Acidimicrobiales bacterium]